MNDKPSENPTQANPNCSICSQLEPKEYGFQKYAREDDATFLPTAASSLIVVKDLKPHSNRQLQLQQCPECHTYYLYRTDYEYLADGSEDEQFLTRLSPKEAAPYLSKSD